VIYESRLGGLTVPDCTITELVFEGFAGRELEPALIDGPTGRVVTGGAFRSAVERLAGGLAVRGFEPGSVSALLSPNTPEFAVAFHAAAWAGGATTTLNPSYTAEEIARQIGDSGAEILFAAPSLVPVARAASKGSSVREIVALGPAEDDPADEAGWATPLGEAMGAPMARQVRVDPSETLGALPYSSGTTGLPKGVMLTHRNLVANVEQVARIIPAGTGTRTLAFLPYFHIYGMTVLMNLYLAKGGVQVTMPRFEMEAALGLIEAHRIEHLFVAPPVILALARHPKVADYDLTSLDFVLSGAAPLGIDLAAECAARIGCETIQGYGMTEMSPVSHFTPPGRNRPGASGLLTPGAEARLVDPATGTDAVETEADGGAEGELWVRGPQVMKGYLGRPDATAETLMPDGWLRTGDIARIDGNGYLFVVDRVKELIKVSGFQVAPAELEALIVTHPGVADVAVVGEPCAETGERPVAHVVLRAGSGLQENDIVAFVEGRVASYKRIARVRFVASIPKSPSGKILRRQLKQEGGAIEV
jgi:acyl-CoA synthetase (AMP-forming)/AMP-acid ligase II